MIIVKVDWLISHWSSCRILRVFTNCLFCMPSSFLCISIPTFLTVTHILIFLFCSRFLSLFFIFSSFILIRYILFIIWLLSILLISSFGFFRLGASFVDILRFLMRRPCASSSRMSSTAEMFHIFYNNFKRSSIWNGWMLIDIIYCNGLLIRVIMMMMRRTFPMRWIIFMFFSLY